MSRHRLACLTIFSSDCRVPFSVDHPLQQQMRVGHDALQRVVDLVRHPGRQLPNVRQALRLHDPPRRELPHLLVPLLQRRGHEVEGVGQVPQFVMGANLNSGVQVAVGDLFRRRRQLLDRDRDLTGDEARQRKGDQRPDQRYRQEDHHGALPQIDIFLLEHADAERANDAAGQVPDRFIGGDVPVIHHKSPVDPGLALLHDLFVNVFSYPRPDRP